MAQEQTVKCRFCKKEIPKSQAYKVGDKSYYCGKDCYESSLVKNKSAKSNSYTPKEGSQKRCLTDYIQDIYISNGREYEIGYEKYQKQRFWGMISAQIKNLIDTYGCTYGGIQYTLYYMKDIEEVALFDDKFEGTILNLIPFFSDKAKKYYNELE